MRPRKLRQEAIACIEFRRKVVTADLSRWRNAPSEYGWKRSPCVWAPFPAVMPCQRVQAAAERVGSTPSCSMALLAGQCRSAGAAGAYRFKSPLAARVTQRLTPIMLLPVGKGRPRDEQRSRRDRQRGPRPNRTSEQEISSPPGEDDAERTSRSERRKTEQWKRKNKLLSGQKNRAPMMLLSDLSVKLCDGIWAQTKGHKEAAGSGKSKQRKMPKEGERKKEATGSGARGIRGGEAARNAI